MDTDTAVQHYGSRAKLALALGISQAAISMWHGSVPALRQLQLERLTGGVLKADSDVFAKAKAPSS